MFTKRWKKFALLLVSGSVLLQVTACTQTAFYLSSLSSLVTAGGVLYLVDRVMD